jgi:hypothetical protein
MAALSAPFARLRQAGEGCASQPRISQASALDSRLQLWFTTNQSVVSCRISRMRRISAKGAAQVSPARKCWVRNTNTTQRRRCATNSWRSPYLCLHASLAGVSCEAGRHRPRTPPKTAPDSFSNLKFPISNRSWPAAAGPPTLISAPHIADGRTLCVVCPPASGSSRRSAGSAVWALDFPPLTTFAFPQAASRTPILYTRNVQAGAT